MNYDFIVIGAGIAGASVAAELARDVRVLLLEMEKQPGYHTTGRSAAMFVPSFGPPAIRALTRASEGFFRAPPDGFTDHPMFSPRAIVMIARADQLGKLDAMMAALAPDVAVERLDAAQLRAAQPLLREGYAMGGLLDVSGQDIDVHALHQGYLAAFRRAGGELVTNSPVSAMQRQGAGWQVSAGGADFSAPVVVNAAGAWADIVADMAGARPIGLMPKRRSAMIVEAPPGLNSDPWPMTVDMDDQFYLKPEAGRLLISPTNQDPDIPSDVQPEEMDVALCIDRIERAFDVSVTRILRKWAGLRSFVADEIPVVGFCQQAEGFFWMAGQGGVGIQTSPAMSRLGAALAQGQEVPSDIVDQGLDPASLAPDRPGIKASAT